MNSPKPRKSHNNATLTIRLPEPILAQLTSIADAQYKTASVVVREEIVKYIQQNQIFLTTQMNPQMPNKKPMSVQEFKFFREQQMRGADMPTSPSQRINDSDLADWD